MKVHLPFFSQTLSKMESCLPIYTTLKKREGKKSKENVKMNNLKDFFLKCIYIHTIYKKK